MKLYELHRKSRFKLAEDPKTPPGAKLGDKDKVYILSAIDGMYSYCTDEDTHDVYHFAAWTEVEEVKDES